MSYFHNCAAPRCARQIRKELLMCPAHWRRLPRALQQKVYRAYEDWRTGQPGTLEALIAVQKEAVAAVGGQARKEAAP